MINNIEYMTNEEQPYPSIRYERLEGYGKHKKKVVLTINKGQPVAEVYLDDENFTMIDIGNLYLLESNSFIAHKRNDGQLCARANGESRAYLHRLILQPSKKLQVDHINHNPLDNRVRNLRECSAKQNSLAKRDSRVNWSGGSGFLGVSNYTNADGDLLGYLVRHPVQGTYSKVFDCAMEAAMFRDEIVEDYYWGQHHGGTWFTSNFINWNFEPESDGIMAREAYQYNGYMDYIYDETLTSGIEWLKQQAWAKLFYESYMSYYGDNNNVEYLC